jgi:CTP synthase
MKCDPYLNVDPGTMNPYQHGEVYVTEDGAETDLDLGHYERFTSNVVTHFNNVTTGQVYLTVINKERRGDYLGRTVQVIPHITDEIKDRIRRVSKGKHIDIVITEIGGTAGDIESLPFLEAIRQLPLEMGKENVIFVHLTLVPYIHAAGELKTKPTQHSVGTLREIGIQPDILLCRTEKKLGKSLKEKISLFCNVEEDAVIEAKDVQSIYEVPLIFREQNLDRIILRKLKLRSHRGHLLEKWKKEVVDKALEPKHSVCVAVVGKYIELQDAYKSIYEALKHGGIANDTEVVVKRINSEEIEGQNIAEVLQDVDGVLVPGGFGGRGIEGKVKAVQFARENGIPFFGICLGMQIATIEFARNVLGWKDANSTEFNKNTPHPVISLLEEQKKVTDLGGTMRLGAYPCRLKKGSLALQAYKARLVHERHRHRFEFNSEYRDEFEKRGFIPSGIYEKGKLVEIIELKDHPWFVGCQFHPEFKSKPDHAHPLFREFVRASLARRHAQRVVEIVQTQESTVV